LLKDLQHFHLVKGVDLLNSKVKRKTGLTAFLVTTVLCSMLKTDYDKCEQLFPLNDICHLIPQS